MTDNLRYKIDQILEYMQNEYLSIATKLDNIITLLGGVPPESSVTLQNVVDAIQNGNALLSDIVTGVTSMDQRLNRLELGLTLPIGSGISSVQSNVNTAVGHLSTIISILNAAPYDDQLEALNTLISQLANVRSSLGVLPSAESTPVRDLLIAMRDCMCSTGVPPEEGEGETCVTSNGTAEYGWPIPSNPAITLLYRTVTWAEAPTGTEFVEAYDIETENTALEPIESWLGWTIYVQSSSHYFQLYPGVLTSGLTNTWIDMPGNGVAIAPSVSTSETIVVTLCPPGEEEVDPCITQASESVAVSPSDGYSPREMAIFPTRNPQPDLNWPGETRTFTPAAVHHGDFSDHLITYVSGRVRVVYGVDGVSIHAAVLDAVGETVVLPAGTDYVCFGDETGTANEPGTGPFSVEWCTSSEA